jgi:hypothetical protein
MDLELVRVEFIQVKLLGVELTFMKLGVRDGPVAWVRCLEML